MLDWRAGYSLKKQQWIGQLNFQLSQTSFCSYHKIVSSFIAAVKNMLARPLCFKCLTLLCHLNYPSKVTFSNENALWCLFLLKLEYFSMSRWPQERNALKLLFIWRAFLVDSMIISSCQGGGQGLAFVLSMSFFPSSPVSYSFSTRIQIKAMMCVR